MKRVWLALVLAAAPAFAQESDSVNYRVKDGDTLSLIAAEYYGDRKKAIFIMAENKMTKARPLRPGERLRIPVNREITTSPNDTFETLAGTYLGDARRGVFLAEFNSMSPDDRLPAGIQLQVPFTITHKAENTETFASVAASLLGDKSQGEMLRGYNFAEKTSIEKDETIQVPVANVRVPASKMPAVDGEAKTRRQARRDALHLAATNIPRAWAAWRTGETKTIETVLADIDADYLDTTEEIAVLLLRGLAAAAAGNKELAIEQFKAVHARNESYVLKKFDYSPKILELWKPAGGSSD